MKIYSNSSISKLNSQHLRKKMKVVEEATSQKHDSKKSDKRQKKSGQNEQVLKNVISQHNKKSALKSAETPASLEIEMQKFHKKEGFNTLFTYLKKEGEKVKKEIQKKPSERIQEHKAFVEKTKTRIIDLKEKFKTFFSDKKNSEQFDAIKKEVSHLKKSLKKAIHLYRSKKKGIRAHLQRKLASHQINKKLNQLEMILSRKSEKNSVNQDQKLDKTDQSPNFLQPKNNVSLKQPTTEDQTSNLKANRKEIEKTDSTEKKRNQSYGMLKLFQKLKQIHAAKSTMQDAVRSIKSSLKVLEHKAPKSTKKFHIQPNSESNKILKLFEKIEKQPKNKQQSKLKELSISDDTLEISSDRIQRFVVEEQHKIDSFFEKKMVDEKNSYQNKMEKVSERKLVALDQAFAKNEETQAVEERFKQEIEELTKSHQNKLQEIDKEYLNTIDELEKETGVTLSTLNQEQLLFVHEQVKNQAIKELSSNIHNLAEGLMDHATEVLDSHQLNQDHSFNEFKQ